MLKLEQIRFHIMYRLKQHQKLVISLLAVCSIVFLPVLMNVLLENLRDGPITSTSTMTSSHKKEANNAWLTRLTLNVLGYASVFVPIYGLAFWLKRIHFFDTHQDRTFLHRLLRLIVVGQPAESVPLSSVTSHVETRSGFSASEKASTRHNVPESYYRINYVLPLLGCSCGLLLSFLTWGVFQERIMTMEYNGEHFRDSQFLVFLNRVFGVIFAIIIGILSYVLPVLKQPPHKAPFLDYSYSALSNTLSTWFQYEALKFVSFPTQVLSKACKIIPVMLMGRLVSHKTYQLHEYGTAGLISIGVALFLLTSDTSDDSKSSLSMVSTSISGIMLLMGYMLFDSFTANWQDKMFKQYSVTSLQMMARSNVWSCALTFISLMQQNSLVYAFRFSLAHPWFLRDALLLSISSTVGQIFIFYTISRFGAVTFIIIMTVRQAVAILLSCFIYGHTVPLYGAVGIVFVFIALFARIYLASHSRPNRSTSPRQKHVSDESQNLLLTSISSKQDEGRSASSQLYLEQRSPSVRRTITNSAEPYRPKLSS